MVSGDARDDVGANRDCKCEPYTTPALTSTAYYWVRVSDATGSIDSATATVTVEPPQPADNAGSSEPGSSEPNMPDSEEPEPETPDPGAAEPGPPDSGSQQPDSPESPGTPEPPDERIRDAGYSGSSPLGENIAAGYPTPSAVVSAWMSSSGHCANIMSPGFQSIGVGYAFSGDSTYGHYWTQDFGGS